MCSMCSGGGGHVIVRAVAKKIVNEAPQETPAPQEVSPIAVGVVNR